MKYKQTHLQQSLTINGIAFDNVSVKNPQRAAVILGDYYEEASLQLINQKSDFKRLKVIPSQGASPDLKSNTSFCYLESKAAGPSGRRFLMYEDQFIKYKKHLQTYWPENPNTEVFDPDILYMFWIHGANNVGSDYKTRDDLREALSGNTRYVFIVSFEIIKRIFKTQKTKKEGVWVEINSPYIELRLGAFRSLIQNDPLEFLSLWNIYKPFADKFTFTNEIIKDLPVYDTIIKQVEIKWLIHRKTHERLQFAQPD